MEALSGGGVTGGGVSLGRLARVGAFAVALAVVVNVVIRTVAVSVLGIGEGTAEVLRTIVHHYPEYRRFVGVTVDEDGQVDEETLLGAVRRGRVGIRVRLDGAA